MSKAFYDIIVNNYAEDSVLTARCYQDKTVSVRIKRGHTLIHSSDNAGFIESFINRANEKLKGSSSSQFKIAFDYRNHRLHFKVRKGGVIFRSTSQRVLNNDNRTEILFNSSNELFYANGREIFEKFLEMKDCAMGFIQIINYNINKR